MPYKRTTDAGLPDDLYDALRDAWNEREAAAGTLSRHRLVSDIRIAELRELPDNLLATSLRGEIEQAKVAMSHLGKFERALEKIIAKTEEETDA